MFLITVTAGAADVSQGANGVMVNGRREAFCVRQRVRDLARPIRGLHPLRPLPASGRLPSGPVDLEVLPESPRVLVGASKIGLVFAATHSTRLNWSITGRLSRIDQGGRARGAVRVRRWRLREAGPSGHTRDIGFRVGGRPSLYRAVFRLRDTTGHQLGHYIEYFRVVRHEVKTALQLSAKTYGPSSILRARLENHGTATIYYGYDLVVERWTGASWERDPATPKSWPLEGLGLAGGDIGDCEALPLGSAQGPYRLVKMIGTALSGHERSVKAYFRIAP